MIRQQKKNAEEDSDREKKLKESLSIGLSRLEENFDKSFSALKKEIEKHQNEIGALKMDKLEKDDFYKDMGGWRSELNRVQDLIIAQNNTTLEKIIELWKGQK